MPTYRKISYESLQLFCTLHALSPIGRIYSVRVFRRWFASLRDFWPRIISSIRGLRCLNFPRAARAVKITPSEKSLRSSTQDLGICHPEPSSPDGTRTDRPRMSLLKSLGNSGSIWECQGSSISIRQVSSRLCSYITSYTSPLPKAASGKVVNRPSTYPEQYNTRM